MMADTVVAVRFAQAEDAPVLARLAKQVFSETYGTQIPPATLAAYLGATFAVVSVAKTLEDYAYPTWVALANGES